jgi:hypothetical protein
MGREDGGVILKLVGWLLLLAVAASAALFIYVRVQNPLAIADVTIATTHLGDDPAALRYRADGRIWVATFVRNTGRLPLTLQGIAADAATSEDPFVATELRLGDGETANAGSSAAFSPIAVEPGESVGVVVVFAPNPALRCGALPGEAVAGDEGATVDRFAIRFTVYGIERTQTVTAEEPFATAAPIDRGTCEAVAAAG